MADNTTITLTLGVDDKGSAIIKSFQTTTEGAFKKIKTDSESLVNSVKKHWLGLTAAATATGLAINRAWGLADAAAQYQEQRASLNALASQYGTSASQIISSIQDVSKGLVSMSDTVGIAGSAMAKGLSPEQIINLAGAAETLSNVTGQKVSDAFRNMAESIALGKSRGIEAAVGMIDLKDKYGDLVEKMSEAEKAQKMYAIVMERVNGLQKTMGEGTDSTADKMERFQVQVGNLKIALGFGIIKAVIGLSVAFDWLAGSALIAAQGMAKVFEASNWAQSKLGLTKRIREEGRQAAEYWKQFAVDAGASSVDLTARALANLELLSATSSEVMSAAKGGIIPGGMSISEKTEKLTGTSPAIDFSGSLATSESAAFGAKAMFLERAAGFELMGSEFRQSQAEWDMESLTKTKSFISELGGLYGEQFQVNGSHMEAWKQFEMDTLTAQYEEYSKYVTNKTALDEWYALKKQVIDKTQALDEKKTHKLRLEMYQNMAATWVNLTQALYTATGNKSKELFEVMKVARIAQATVDTYAGATKALADLPYPYSYAAAAAIISGGLANVATIASTNIGGGGGGGSSSFGSVGVHGQGGDYKYFNYEQSQYGSGWRPGEGQGPGKTGDTYIFNGDVYDKEAFDKRVNSAVQQDIKDNGKTRDVIQRYA